MAFGCACLNPSPPPPPPPPIKVLLDIQVEGQGVTAPSGQTQQEQGKSVQITATPAENWKFKEWQGASICQRTSPKTSVTVDISKTITAVFERITYLITIEQVGDGSVEPESGEYGSGIALALRATPNAGWDFKRWEGPVADNLQPETTLLVKGPEVIRAVFLEKPPPYVWPPDVPDLETWLNQHPGVRQAAVVELYDADGKNVVVGYDQWPVALKRKLFDAYVKAFRKQPSGLADPPANQAVLEDAKGIQQVYSVDDGQALYLAFVANSFAVEIDQRVPWSLAEYDADSLAILLDSRSFFGIYKTNPAKVQGYAVSLTTSGATISCPPERAIDWLTTVPGIGPDKVATITNLITWFRWNVIHFMGGYTTANVYDQWQYRGFIPASRVMEGTPVLSARPIGTTIRHRTGGCHGTTGFFMVVLRSVNIPVSNNHFPGNGHSMPGFPTEKLYLSHGDDPYNSGLKAPEIPTIRVLVDEVTFRSWFPGPVENPALYVGRQVRELIMEYLTSLTLKVYCRDIANGKSHADGEVLLMFRDHTLAELEAMDLWGRMAEKVSQQGGCGGLASPKLGLGPGRENEDGSTADHTLPPDYEITIKSGNLVVLGIGAAVALTMVMMLYRKRRRTCPAENRTC